VFNRVPIVVGGRHQRRRRLPQLIQQKQHQHYRQRSKESHRSCNSHGRENNAAIRAMMTCCYKTRWALLRCVVVACLEIISGTLKHSTRPNKGPQGSVNQGHVVPGATLTNHCPEQSTHLPSPTPIRPRRVQEFNMDSFSSQIVYIWSRRRAIPRIYPVSRYTPPDTPERHRIQSPASHARNQGRLSSANHP
jgi:hypothetical protein